MFDFELYCDDSGTDGNSPVAVAACYVSTKKHWDEFVRNWDEVRLAEGFDYFHMAEFVAPRETDPGDSYRGRENRTPLRDLGLGWTAARRE